MKKHLARLKHLPARSKSKVVQYLARAKRSLRGGRRLEIEVITMMYNEAFLAPLFVRHYAPWVDKITVFFSQSADDTLSELKAAAAQCRVKTLKIVPFEFPNGFDDWLKVDCLNRAVRESSADFAICVDADEFVHPWPFENTNPRDELAKETGEVVHCAMFESYRHVTDKDIDRTQPPLFQRRHGTFNVGTEVEGGKTLPKDRYTKPCIVRPGSGAQFELGCHRLSQPKRGSTIWRGVHWGKADDFCTWRYVRDRRDRLSERNRRLQLGVEHFDKTEQKLLAELKANENHPRLF
jgi:hypothetical protein